MGLLSKLIAPKKKPKLEITARGYVNGVEVPLKDDNSTPEEMAARAHRHAVMHEVKDYESIVVGFATTQSHKLPVDDQITLLESLVSAYNDLKNACYALGDDGVQYFNDAWENCRKKETGIERSYVYRYKVKLASLYANYTSLKEQEEIRNKELPRLYDNVLSYIALNQPIKQTEIYKGFPPAVKDDIKSILYEMAKNNTIKREKNGSSYLIML